MVVYLYNSKSVVLVCRHSFGCIFLEVSYLSFSDLREVSDLEVRLLLFSLLSCTNLFLGAYALPFVRINIELMSD